MQINITLDGTEGSHELNALAALIASLGGRTAGPATMAVTVDVPNAPITSTSASGPAVSATSTVPTPPAPAQDPDEIEDPAAAAGAPDRDSAGLPWDERIHASSRATLQDGTWRRRKNTDDALFESVMAELRAAHPTTPASEDVPPPPPTTTNDTPEPPAPEPVVTAPVAVVAEPAADIPPPPAGEVDLSTFAKFVQAVNAKDVPAERKVYAELNKLAKEVADVDAFKDLLKKPEAWQLFYDMLG